MDDQAALREQAIPPAVSAALLAELRATFPGERLVSAAEELFVYECDAQRFDRGQPLAIVFPETTAEVSAAVRACAKHGVPFLPRGAGTGLSGGAVARGSVLISTARMAAIHELDVANRQAWVGPGVVNAHLIAGRPPPWAALRARPLQPERLHDRRQRRRPTPAARTRSSTASPSTTSSASKLVLPDGAVVAARRRRRRRRPATT